jgi:hypothetical protein
VVGQCKRRHRHQEFLQFLKHIDADVGQVLSLLETFGSDSLVLGVTG